HLGLRDEAPPGCLPAALRERLVLHVNSAGTDRLELLNRPLDVREVPEARVHVAEGRERGRLHDIARVVKHLREAQEPDVGEASAKKTRRQAGERPAPAGGDPEPLRYRPGKPGRPTGFPTDGS